MIEGKFVRLREYKREDLEKARAFINNFEIKKNLILGIPFPLRVEDEIKWYEEINPHSEKSYSFAIELKEIEEYIGGCGIFNINWKNSFCEVGIFLGPEYLSKGYGAEAMKLLVNFIFTEMNLNKVRLSVFSFNKRAIRSYEKVGFKKEGVLREEIYRDGKYWDVIVMGILKREWFDDKRDENVL
ncbi:acetyltransferase [Thermosipho melanesiensis]|uniref:GCN5-related N-acetyltransferase n=2 Tax=Thermosipho melanesiensis TaxID=46541 RepID=A6LP15_THEM4|nr:GNAT family protein [Thermosipho melanesiensis]ABR31666.1 GCN5-related N-acetyltransferase [Thermosipho melanesiensis BI429]APT74693.1 acetyltransferase [Thermosipho melanesiensis]OOC35190.1 acetyltransferase [Thermosipho melanesiensis]OOC35400.1 acetyltransferase [Thermosipho melanesiensis]OOC36651.1 acetyltransferase [Thermosipho melanesiensis]